MSRGNPKNIPCEEVYTSQRDIQSQLLDSLTDKNKVALLLDEDDLDMLIDALEDVANDTTRSNCRQKRLKFLHDMRQLKKVTFG